MPTVSYSYPAGSRPSVWLVGCFLIALSAGCAAPRSSALQRGYAQLTQGNPAAARGTFEAVLRTAGGHTARGEAFLGLAQCHLAEGAHQEAVTALERARALLVGSPHTQTIELQLAECFLHLGSYDRARRHLETAYSYLDAGYQRERCAMLLGLLFERTGHRDRAQRYYEVAGAAAQTHPEVQQWRERLLPPAPPAREVVVRPTPTPASAGSRERDPPEVATVSGRLRIEPRASWRARATRRNVQPMERPTRITVHHTGEAAPPSLRRQTDVVEYLQRLQLSHQGHKGWADIGYHYLIDAAGRIWEGRPAGYQGAHAGSPTANEANLGIALIGNFDVHRPAKAQVTALQALLVELQARHRITARHVFTHQRLRKQSGLEYTDCPGRYLMQIFPTLLAAVPDDAGEDPERLAPTRLPDWVTPTALPSPDTEALAGVSGDSLEPASHRRGSRSSGARTTVSSSLLTPAAASGSGRQADGRPDADALACGCGSHQESDGLGSHLELQQFLALALQGSGTCFEGPTGAGGSSPQVPPSSPPRDRVPVTPSAPEPH